MSGIVAFLPLIGKAIDRLFPDPAQRDAAKLKLLEMQQQGELAELDADLRLALGQIEINKEEARSAHWWVAAWRPFIGWVCGVALAWNFIVYPTVVWAGVDAPALDVAQLMIVLGGLLGIGGLRSLDKRNGVETRRVNGA